MRPVLQLATWRPESRGSTAAAPSVAAGKELAADTRGLKRAVAQADEELHTVRSQPQNPRTPLLPADERFASH